MLTLTPPDSHFWSAAVGWLELGNAAEARAELERLSAKLQVEPEILEFKWTIFAEEKNWQEALKIARELVAKQPDQAAGWLHQAYALRRVPQGGLQAAWETLLPAAQLFPGNPTIVYNLACYACQLQNLDDARKLLRAAVQLGDKDTIKKMALADDDLKPLWDEIRHL